MTKVLKTSVCIIGSGPSGLLLSQLLANHGIDTIVIDRKDREYIEGRIRAGVLESGTVEALEEAGAADRLHKEGIPHHGFDLAFDGDRHRIDIHAHTNKTVTVYGQTEVTKDLFDKRTEQGQKFFFNIEDATPINLKNGSPQVHFTQQGEKYATATRLQRPDPAIGFQP